MGEVRRGRWRAFGGQTGGRLHVLAGSAIAVPVATT